jgi:ribonucleoside-diphosphate reductase alpha chain
MGVLRCDHPDIEDFIHAKDHGDLKNFNVSIAVTDAFMSAVQSDAEWELVHRQPPGADFEGSPRQRADGWWIYRAVKARDLWQQIMESTYDHAEPGVYFADRTSADNNLSYVESIEATNPCGEQPLPAYGCCCLGSINLTLFVRDPFRPAARFDFDAFGKVVRPSVRMLDNVLEATVWPLPEQHAESRAKRRVGRGLASAAMVADSQQTQLCSYLSGILLAGLALNALFGWWWADPAAGLIMLPIIAREGWAAWRGEGCGCVSGDCH